MEVTQEQASTSESMMGGTKWKQRLQEPPQSPVHPGFIRDASVCPLPAVSHLCLILCVRLPVWIIVSRLHY